MTQPLVYGFEIGQIVYSAATERIECSADGVRFQQMRICHMHNGKGKIRFGIYACSPEDSSFRAAFSNLEFMECLWKAHDGQKPDEA